MKKTKTGRAARVRRHERVRKTVSGSEARPRLAVYRSLTHIYAQVIDDARGHTLAAASTVEKTLKDTSGDKSAQAKAVGTAVAKKAIDAGVTKVVFDRGGNRYHGRVKALAEAARAAGLQF
jgi:large subunit ribosomal protein L18